MSNYRHPRWRPAVDDPGPARAQAGGLDAYRASFTPKRSRCRTCTKSRHSSGLRVSSLRCGPLRPADHRHSRESVLPAVLPFRVVLLELERLLSLQGLRELEEIGNSDTRIVLQVGQDRNGNLAHLSHEGLTLRDPRRNAGPEVKI